MAKSGKTKSTKAAPYKKGSDKAKGTPKGFVPFGKKGK